MYSKFLCGTTLLVVFVLYVESTGHGGSGPIIIKTQGRHGRNNDLVMIGGQTKCGHGPTLIKTGGGRHSRHGGSDLILIGGQNKCHEKKKVEHVPVPYPVKEYVPVPYKETVHIPVHVPVHMPMKKEESYGDMGGMSHDMGGMMDMDMGGYGGYGGWRRK